MTLNDCGRLTQGIWEGLPERFATIALDRHIIMPNHVHGIIMVGAQFIVPSSDRDTPSPQGTMNPAPTLGGILRTFKAVSTRLLRRHMCAEFSWQRNYYERVVRNEDELKAIREYIFNNPAR
jgi:REP element-mobilizing transposase RayT